MNLTLKLYKVQVSLHKIKFVKLGSKFVSLMKNDVEMIDMKAQRGTVTLIIVVQRDNNIYGHAHASEP